MSLIKCKYVLTLSGVAHDSWTTNTSLPGRISNLVSQAYKNYPYFHTFKNEVLVKWIFVNSLIFYLLIILVWIKRDLHSSRSEEWSTDTKRADLPTRTSTTWIDSFTWIRTSHLQIVNLVFKTYLHPTQVGLGVFQAIHCEAIQVSTVYCAVCQPVY